MLNTFSEEYLNSTEAFYEDGVYRVNNKILYVDKKTGSPIKLEVQDNNKNTKVYILYNEIKINSIKGEDVFL